MSVYAIAAAVNAGELIRVRRGHYALAETDSATMRAVRVGGRLACLSELTYRGIWVLDDDRLHVHVAANASRLRNPDERSQRLADGAVCVHWRPLAEPSRATPSHVGTVDALIQASYCLGPRELAASVDSALHLKRITLADIPRVAAGLPLTRARQLRTPVRAAESGIESIARELLRDVGVKVRSQARFPGVGRADLLVEDWIVVETDGDEFHDEKVTTYDRNRDAALVRRGRTTLHFRYATVVFDPATVVTTVIEAIRVHRNIRNSGQIADRALRRAQKLGLA